MTILNYLATPILDPKTIKDLKDSNVFLSLLRKDLLQSYSFVKKKESAKVTSLLQHEQYKSTENSGDKEIIMNIVSILELMGEDILETAGFLKKKCELPCH
jgi:hypothetical protein